MVAGRKTARTLKLTVAYDGTAYAGWQRQRNADSIQAHLESALQDIEGRPVTVHGAGRTDAGTHALGQVASVTVEHPIPVLALTRAFNAKLPMDIRVSSVVEMPERFHARYDARRKTYRYRIGQAAVPDPMELRFAWHIGAPLDVDAMRQAAAHFVGHHDFAAFQTSASRATVGSTDRTVLSVTIAREPGAVLTIEVCGAGFLRHMVRTMVGTLTRVGLGRRAPEWVATVLRSRRRDQAGPTAPARGLFLVSVDYSSA